MKKIKLYHGTKQYYTKLDLSLLSSFSEGYGIYMTSSPSYAMTYTCKPKNTLVVNLRGVKSEPQVLEQSCVHEVEVPVSIISNEYTKRIPIKDFYSLYNKFSNNMKTLQKVDFSKPDFAIFNGLVNAILINIKVSKYNSKIVETKVLKEAFKFMVYHDYHVIRVEQPTRSMVKEFYLMLDVDMFNNGKVYELDEVK